MRRSTCDGSSPRSRGTLNAAMTAAVLGRFIPALAGNTCCSCRCPSRAPVHPRARGEHLQEIKPKLEDIGSSPRSRGTLVYTLGSCRVGRFIPALAGNTCKQCHFPSGKAVHPRARGEHGSSRMADSAICGSSPRSRGTPAAVHVSPCGSRFIPALAGNTMAALSLSSHGTVHPRARGEHIGGTRLSAYYDGSSPRSRGTHFL